MKPDIILCDWLMRPMSGIELLREIRRSRTPITARTPVIMMTGQLDVSSVLEAREVGVDGYIAKPVTVEGLMTRLVDVIRSSAPMPAAAPNHAH